MRTGVIGEGKMGTSIFNYVLDFNFDLVWVCSPATDTGKLNSRLAKRFMRSLDAGIIDRQRFDNLMSIPVTSDLKALTDCDLVIEAVPENLELKKDIFARLDKIVKPEAIFTSNSSSINPSEIMPGGRHSGQFAGLHFFYPVALKNIVEVTLTESTSDETLFLIESFLAEIHRRYLTLGEKNSFMLNKIFLDVQNEAFLIVKAGQCSFIQMDQLVKNHLFPFGIFDFCDSVGLDTMLASVINYTQNHPHKRSYSGFMSALADLVSEGRLGTKTRKGFYTYPLENPTDEVPLNEKEIAQHLRQTWLSSAKRFTALAHVPIDDANHAIREYFDVQKGPFE